MPRPGPRPYECVKRGWHSDRHQPIRGSLIQEILRIANEIHSSTTKNNKEWQEKLPVVVLKAEEIMYSKANSEAEYTDLKTLMERVNDAINTIIRRDEGAESGDFLQPCIEAALNLGCVPRRTSRSQRNSSSSCYLSASASDAREGIPTSLLASNGLRSMNTNSKGLDKDLSCITTVLTFMSNKLHGSDKHCPVPEASQSSRSDSVYPLYHEMHRKTPEKISEMECDLSLRLGPVSVPGMSLQRTQTEPIKFNETSEIKPGSYSGRSLSGEEALIEATMVRKRKAVTTMEGQQFFQQPRLLAARYAAGARIAGL